MSATDEKIGWLCEQLERWVCEGIIDTTKAESIRRLYPPLQTKTSRPWALIVFSGIGAVIVGLGVILLFAYNWHDMSKFAKLATIFGSLAIAHLVGVSFFIRSERFAGLGEAITVLGTMLFGAGIWLIAQIYHIEEHYPNAFLFWGIGAMLMAWTMPSVIQAILAAILFTIWASTECVEFSNAMLYVFVLLLLLFPVAYKKYSRALLTVLLLAFAVSAIFTIAVYDNSLLTFYCLLSVFAIYTAVSLLQQRFNKFELFAPVYYFLGMLGYFITLYILTFPDIIKEILHINKHIYSSYYSHTDKSSLLHWIIPLILMATCWFIVGYLKVVKKDKPKFYSHELFLMPLMPIFLFYLAITTAKYLDWPAITVFNLVFLSHCAMMMARGCISTSLKEVSIGSIMLIALVIARFCDLFDSLAVRGLIFVIVGVLIFSQGFFYIRSKKKKALQESGL